MPMPRIAFVGEGMAELRPEADGTCRMGHGGDTLNTAIHMARLGCEVSFATALGSDPFSAKMRAAWADEGLDCSAVLTDPARGMGLYAISLDAAGERSFTYWRSDSAARRLFELPGAQRVAETAHTAAAMAFSLISLAILEGEGREALILLARSVREAGGLVAFDGNYRPGLWENPRTAAHWRDRAIAVASIGLPTLDDERKIDGPMEASDVAERWTSLGCGETIVKLGADGCRLPDGSEVAPPALLSPVDTSGAGDAFNAGYLCARLSGTDQREAANLGNAVAGWTIMRAGAIPPRDAAAPYPAAG